MRIELLAHPATDDAPGVHINDKGHVLPTLPRRHICEIADPKLVQALATELPIDAVRRACRLGIADRGADHLASQSEAAHQPFDDTTCHSGALAPSWRQTFTAP